MNKNEIYKKYAEYFLANNSEVMEDDARQELESALKDNDDVVHISTVHTADRTVAAFTDKGQMLYVIIEFGMIFVDTHMPDELDRLVMEEDYSPLEAYDTSDCIDYYSESKYADLISSVLLETVNRHIGRPAPCDETVVGACKDFVKYMQQRFAGAVDSNETRTAFEDEVFTVSFGSQQVTMSNSADVFNAVENMLETVAEELS